MPYIFSREEVLALLDAATRHEGCSMRGAMLRALTLVLNFTGMRLGEAVRLSMGRCRSAPSRLDGSAKQGTLAHPGDP